MARIAYVEESGALPEQVARIRGARSGKLINLYRLLLHSPPVADGWLAMGGALRFDCQLDRLTRELAIVRVAVLTNVDYEYRAHVRYALADGATQEQIGAMPQWQESELFDDRMRAILAYTDAMTTQIEVPDDVFDAVRVYLDEREIVELTVTISFYNGVSRFLAAMKIDPEGSIA